MIDWIDNVWAVFVSDHDIAIDFYVNTLGFKVNEKASGGKTGVSWVEVGLTDDKDCWSRGKNCIALIRFEDTEGLVDRIGGYTGIIFETGDIKASYETLKERGVQFDWQPVLRPWGKSDAQFVDQDNNKLLLVDENNIFTVQARHQRPLPQ